MKISAIALVLGIAFACSSGNSDSAKTPTQHAAGAAGRGASAGRAGAPASAGRGGSSPGMAGAPESAGGVSGEAGAGTAGVGAKASGESGAAGLGSGGEGGASTVIALPDGSREHSGVVNLVDAAAASELADFLDTNASGLQSGLNLFLAYYVEQYDFVYLFTDHELDSSAAAGRYVPVTHPAIWGTGIDYDDDEPNYTTNGRTRGVIGVQFHDQGQGPLAHEMLHHWANFLGTSFGLGVGPHWGYAGVNGFLGGFDPSTLHCVTPAGATPPACTAETDGTFLYRVDSFNTGGNDVPVYAPLELYLMGLLPIADVPTPIPVLDNATTLTNTYDQATNTIEVSASGVTEVDTSAITQRWGTVHALSDSERAFTSAFVVISAAPATDAVLDNIAARAALFGGRSPHDPMNPSFAELTGNRATMDTRLGPRRPADAPPLPVRVHQDCDPLHNDCGADESCHFFSNGNVCGFARGAARDAACTTSSDCAAGLYCAPNQGNSASACEPYCSIDNTSADACTCDAWWLQNSAGVPVVGACMAP